MSDKQPGQRVSLQDLIGEPEPPEQPPAETAVAVPDPEPPRAQVPATVATWRPGATADAITALLAAHDSARRSPREWAPYTVRLPDDIARALDRRVLEDYEGTGISFARAHYVQAALSRLPFADPEKCARIGEEWRAGQPRAVTAAAATPGTRARRDTAAAMRLLARQLRTLDAPARLQDVAAGAVAGLLAELADAGDFAALIAAKPAR